MTDPLTTQNYPERGILKRKTSNVFSNGSTVFIPMLFYAFFCQSLASTRPVLYTCLFISIASLFWHFITNGKFATRRFGLEVSWVPFLLCFYIHSLIFGVSNTTLFVVYTLLFITMYVCSNEKEWVAACFAAVIVFASFHAICTLILWAFPSLYPTVKAAFFSGSYMARDYRSGFTSHYSTNAIYLSLGLVCLAGGLSGGIRRITSVKYPLLAILLLVSLVLTTKRGPLIAAACSVLAVYVYVNRKRSVSTAMKLLLIAGLIAGFTLALATFIPAVDATLDRFAELTIDDTGSGRTYLYEYAWRLFEQSPMLGNGWGSYASYLNTTSLGVMYSNLGFASMSAHNVFLQLLAETGIVGMLLFLLPAIATLVYTIRESDAAVSEKPFDCAFCLRSSAALQLFFLIYCLSGNPLYDVQCYLPYFMVCAASFSVGRTKPQRKKGRSIR